MKQSTLLFEVIKHIFVRLLKTSHFNSNNENFYFLQLNIYVHMNIFSKLKHIYNLHYKVSYYYFGILHTIHILSNLQSINHIFFMISDCTKISNKVQYWPILIHSLFVLWFLKFVDSCLFFVLPTIKFSLFCL